MFHPLHRTKRCNVLSGPWRRVSMASRHCNIHRLEMAVPYCSWKADRALRVLLLRVACDVAENFHKYKIP